MLLELTEAVKEIYVRHVDMFVTQGKHMIGAGSPHKLDLRLNPALWDFRAKTVRNFVEGLVRAGAKKEAPRVMLGYHGTPSRNTDRIMSNGFDPKMRRSAGDGAYFSGELSYSVSYARKAGGPEPGDVLLVALIEVSNLARRPDSHLINAQGAVFKEENTLPLARLRGF